MDEVNIAGIEKNDPSLSDSTSYYVHGKFSIGPEKKLNWYFHGSLLLPDNPHYTMESDGLHAVLHIKESTKEFRGLYELRVEGTSISDYINFHLGKFKKKKNKSMSVLLFLCVTFHREY